MCTVSSDKPVKRNIGKQEKTLLSFLRVIHETQALFRTGKPDRICAVTQCVSTKRPVQTLHFTQRLLRENLMDAWVTCFGTFSRMRLRECEAACPSRHQALCSDIPVSWEYDSVRSYRSSLARDRRGEVGKEGLGHHTSEHENQPCSSVTYLQAQSCLTKKYDVRDISGISKLSKYRVCQIGG